jgi:hypothetical protein
MAAWNSMSMRKTPHPRLRFIQRWIVTATGWTRIWASRKLSGMVRRRSVYNPLDPASMPRWYVVRSMHGSILESRRLAVDANLTHVFITAMLAWMEGGWAISEFSSRSATFFCTRGTERRMVSIDPTDPYDVPMYGGSHLAARGGETD